MTYYLNTIYKWEGDSTQPLDDLFTWKSGRKLLPHKTSFTHARIIADVGDREAYNDAVAAAAALVTANATMVSNLTMGGSIGEDLLGDERFSVGGDLLVDIDDEELEYSGDYRLTFNLYVDGTLRFTKDVYSADKPFRIRHGRKGRAFEIEVTGNVPVRRVDVAQSLKELMAPDGGA